MRKSGRLLAAGVCWACVQFWPHLSMADELLLGVIADLSGLGHSYGVSIVQGAEMAVRDINAAGGVNGRQVKLVVADDASNPARSAIEMRQLIASQVTLIVGGWGSSQVLANMDVAEEAGVPYIVVGATSPRITSLDNRWTFRVIPSDSVMAEQLASIVTKRLRMTRIAVISDSNAYGAGNRDVFIAALARLGVVPVAVQSYQTADKEFSAQLANIRAANPDGIAIFGTVPAAPAIMNQARAFGIGARFVGTGGLANDALISLAPAASEGAVLMTFFNEEVDADSRLWAERYRKEFADRQEPPRPVLAAWEYRAIREIAAPCLAAGGPDMAALRDCLTQWKGTPFGVTGTAYFDETQQLVQPPLVVEVKDGTFRLFRESD